MDHVSDDLIGLQRARPRANRRAQAAAWVFRLAGNLITGIAIGAGIAAGLMLAGQCRPVDFQGFLRLIGKSVRHEADMKKARKPKPPSIAGSDPRIGVVP